MSLSEMPTDRSPSVTPQDMRVIVYHKQSTSARTRFLRLGHGGVCAFDPLPSLSVAMEEGEEDASVVTPHPAALLTEAESRLALAPGGLVLESEFCEKVEVPTGTLTVYLARCTTTDPPFAEARRLGASFIALTEARDLSPPELELLRRAYAVIMGD